MDAGPFMAQKAKITGDKLTVKKDSFVNSPTEPPNSAQKISPTSKKKVNITDLTPESNCKNEGDSEVRTPQRPEE